MKQNPEAIDLSGLCDLHIHTAPDVRARKLDDVEVARQAAEAGLKAVLIKSHVTLTADRASLAEKAVGGRVRVLGGLALNSQVGGLNPSAVETALALGAKEVWLPTFSAKGRGEAGIVVTDEEGKLLPVVYEIFELLKKSDAVLGAGHLSLAEIVTVVKEARRQGLRRILITHPDNPLVGMPISLQAELVREGAYFERTYESALVHPDGIPALARAIREVGPETTIITSDLGQAHNPPPVEGYRVYIAALQDEGITPAEIRLMADKNPSTLFDLN